jgi:Na+-translocating ferredoxin:NAD+ oxidoreductase RnfD subunit
MPTNVRRFLWLWCAAFLIGAAEIPLTPPNSTLQDFGVTQPVQTALAAGGAAISLATLLPFLWFALRRRKNWARWVLLVSFIISLPLEFLDPSVYSGDQLPLTLMALVSVLAGAAAFYFLFTGDARPWFREHPSTSSG